jgi:hypothetical protein
MSTSRTHETPWWLWPSALSLEAPAVAVAWQDLLARSNGIVPRIEGRLALGLTVWTVYLADRLIDNRRSSAASERPPHSFSRDHRRMAALLLGLVIAADTFLALCRLRPQVLANGILVAGGVALYLGAFAWRSWFQPAKPWAAASLFAAGVFLVTWTRSDHHGAALIAQALVFFALCLGNLLLARSPGVVAVGMIALTGACLLRAHSLWYDAAGASAAGLAVIALLRPRLRDPTCGLLADLALLLPALRSWG